MVMYARENSQAARARQLSLQRAIPLAVAQRMVVAADERDVQQSRVDAAAQARAKAFIRAHDAGPSAPRPSLRDLSHQFMRQGMSCEQAQLAAEQQLRAAPDARSEREIITDMARRAGMPLERAQHIGLTVAQRTAARAAPPPPALRVGSPLAIGRVR